MLTNVTQKIDFSKGYMEAKATRWLASGNLTEALLMLVDFKSSSGTNIVPEEAVTFTFDKISSLKHVEY